mmetsp:Transcript_10584/g.13724  ORF Transcript_10584/g.13724 Transcript_10584/m.13724 type:complete len:222 (+) Transcript_10584:81-746(+)
MSSLNKPPQYDEMCEILDSEPFSAHTIPKLEEYLQEQISTNTYDFLANKALLKLYQFYPDMTNDEMVALVAVKALMALPSTDLLTLMYLIPDRLAIREPIRTLTRCYETLETAQFKEFWEAANLGSNPTLDNTPGFAESIRTCILGMLSETCQKYPKGTFSEAINLSGAELKKFCDESNLKIEDDMISFILNAENQRKPKKFKETVQLDNMFNIIHAVEGF